MVMRTLTATALAALVFVAAFVIGSGLASGQSVEYSPTDAPSVVSEDSAVLRYSDALGMTYELTSETPD